MTLTAAQAVDARRFAGYATIGDATYAGFQELAYSDTSPYGALSLTTRLANLLPEEEAILINNYLVPLNLREAEIQAAASNLDTDSAAVWTHNKKEVDDRIRLFNYTRRQLCAFLGFEPGPLLGSGNRLVRG